MSDLRTQKALDLVLSAALRSHGWSDVLHFLARETGSVAGGITIENARTREGQPLVFFGFDADHVRKTFDHYLPMNPLFEIAPRMRPGFVVTNGDVVDEAAFRRTEFYNGWARPQALCCPATVVLHRSGDTYCPLTLVRPDGAGDVAGSDLVWLRALAPQLVRAMAITAELENRAIDHHLLDEAAVSGHLGMMVLDARGCVLHANGRAEQVLQGGLGLKSASGVLKGTTWLAERLLAGCVERASATRMLSGEVRLDIEGRPPLLIKVIPIPESSAFSRLSPNRAATLVVIRQPPLDFDGRVAFLSQVYGLTMAERRVLTGLAEGKTLKLLAVDLHVSIATVRTHLRRVFLKTATSRQSQLISLVLKGGG